MQTEEMRDLDKALADIIAIRSQLAAGTAFAGYGPAAVFATAGASRPDNAPTCCCSIRPQLVAANPSACSIFPPGLRV